MNRRRLIGAVTATPLLAGIGLAGVAFAATHRAQHLVITEVGFDTVDETGFTSEYVEIHNPTNAPISLNDGAVPGTANGKGSYFLSDSSVTANLQYWNVVNGSLAVGGSTDFVVQFPVGATIPAHGTLVITDDSDAFLTEFFGGSLARFQNQPSRPQLMEFTQDADTVPDMLIRATGGAGIHLGLTNAGENVVLFNWDGASDLVKDVDIAVYGTPTATNTGPAKTTATTIDGPDAGVVVSAYLADAGVYPVSGGGTGVVARRSLVEKNETDVGGNGITGSDETSELLTPVNVNPLRDDPWMSAPNTGPFTPGMPSLALDSLGVDALSWLRPAAVSSADGPNGTASPLDWGADGTLTEMYVTSLDADRNGTNEAVYVAIRGDMFGEPDTNESNVELLLVDVNPYVSTGGVRRLIAAGSDLNDTDRTIDAVITGASVQMGPSVPLTADWDAAIAFDKLPDLATNQDVLTWNALALGSPTAFVSVPTLARPKFDGNVDAAIFPAAAGTSHAGVDLYEAIIPTALGTLTVTHLGLTAVTTAGDGANASPNTLPEGAYDSTASATVPIERFLCWDVAASKAVAYYVDSDNDGHGNAPSAYCGPAMAGVAAVGDDCNDGNDKVFPGAVEICNSIDDDCDALVDAADSDTVLTTFFADVDNDTFGNPLSTTKACSAPGGFIADSTDCNDANALIKPTGIEICNAVDDDCDTVADDGIPTQTWYLDSDNDLFGGSTSDVGCAAPAGYIATNGDCLDSDPLVNPGAIEVCNLKDDDCDLTVDDGVQTTYYRDVDGDTFGDKLVAQPACSVAPGGYVGDNTDCDDNAAAVKPTAIEVCNGIDDDCDALVDAADSSAVLATFYADTDNDKFGNPVSTKAACSAPGGYIVDNTDCNDADPLIKPTGIEVCNAADDDCNKLVDDGVPTATWYLDSDNDTFGGSTSAVGCAAPAGYVAAKGDCLDSDPLVNPDALEVCNLKDDDCDTFTDEGVETTYYRDVDGDTFGDELVTQAACSVAPGGYVADKTDCDDNAAAVNPDATEVCNSVDDDCDTLVDDGVPTKTWYLDGDSDLYGGSISVVACAAPGGYILVPGDCADGDASVNPGATEVCNAKDDNCDSQTDEGVQTTYYRDSDGDAFGDKLVTQPACGVAPAGYVADQSDCDDSDAAVKPTALEVCNSIDDDCDALTDDLDSSVTGQGSYFADTDGDTFGDPLAPLAVCFPTPSQVLDSTDCNDKSAAINTKAVEICNAIDDDCDNLVDDADVFTGGGLYSIDADNDGFGDDIAVPVHKCAAPAGTVNNDADCDDLDNAVNPVATEICNLVDDDCDGGTDDLDPEGAQGTFWYPDVDTDGHGDDASSGVEQCDPPGLDYSDLNDDCADTVAAINPDALEVCNNVDDDCDQKIDMADPSVTDAKLWFIDVDVDGFGDSEDAGTLFCGEPAGHKLTGTDCKDNDNTVYPGAPEVADLEDNDCDGHDETYDADGDGLDVLAEAANKTDPNLADTDEDGLDDGDEIVEGTNPLVKDTDGDGVFDGAELLDGTDPLVKDTDGDGLEDGAEATAGSDPLVKDTDEDGVEDGDEVADGTSPILADTDGDGVKDGLEARDGTDPLDKSDFHDDTYDGDDDGLPDHTEYTLGTDETKSDTDGGGVDDGDEVAAGTDPLAASDDAVPDTDTGTETDSGLDTDTGPGDTSVEPPEKKCGCESAGTTPLWAFGVVLFGLRRRRVWGLS